MAVSFPPKSLSRLWLRLRRRDPDGLYDLLRAVLAGFKKPQAFERALAPCARAFPLGGASEQGSWDLLLLNLLSVGSWDLVGPEAASRLTRATLALGSDPRETALRLCLRASASGYPNREDPARRSGGAFPMLVHRTLAQAVAFAIESEPERPLGPWAASLAANAVGFEALFHHRPDEVPAGRGAHALLLAELALQAGPAQAGAVAAAPFALQALSIPGPHPLRAEALALAEAAALGALLAPRQSSSDADARADSEAEAPLRPRAMARL